MQARVTQEGEVVVIHLAGRVDVETAEPFRTACLNHLKGKKVVFDFKNLSFVGSSGILPFLETMQDFAKVTGQRFKFSGVGTEFKRVFASTELSNVEIFDTHVQAVSALLRPPVGPTIGAEPVPLAPMSAQAPVADAATTAAQPAAPTTAVGGIAPSKTGS